MERNVGARFLARGLAAASSRAKLQKGAVRKTGEVQNETGKLPKKGTGPRPSAAPQPSEQQPPESGGGAAEDIAAIRHHHGCRTDRVDSCHTSLVMIFGGLHWLLRAPVRSSREWFCERRSLD